ncbi:MAG: mRNA-capping enzyme subunit beta [Chrysothrix sp. TS-e1954]|nr:MAG: mRNA-capping enzyme subunit beta [Chrysothrix sp. TS-e1954]
MDLRSILHEPSNADKDPDSKASSGPQTLSSHSQERHPPLSEIQTGDYPSARQTVPSPYHRQPSYSSLQGLTPYSASPSKAQFPTYHGGALPSPHAISPHSTQHAPGYPSPGYTALSRSPASVQETHGPLHQTSPVLTRHQTYPGQHNMPQGHSHGHPMTTPDPPHSATSRGSIHALMDSPSQYRRPSAASQTPTPCQTSFTSSSSPHARQNTYPPSAPPHQNGHHDYQHVEHVHHVQAERQSVSVSPKTIVTPLPPQEHPRSTLQTHSNPHYSPGSLHIQPHRTPSYSQTQVLEIETPAHLHQTYDPAKSQQSELHVQQSQQSRDFPRSHISRENTDSQSDTMDSSQTITQLQHSSSPQASRLSASSKAPLKSTATKRPGSSSETLDPSRAIKRRRKDAELPVWAHRCKATPPLKRYRIVGAQKHAANSHHQPATSGNGQPDDSAQIGLAAGETSFTEVIPSEEITRHLCDFLYRHIVLNDAAGSMDQGQLEIEAKFGTLIDRSTNERLRLPILTESIVAPGADVSFESDMTSAQHGLYNEFLNRKLEESVRGASANQVQQTKKRTPLEYQHLRQIDTFYDLPKSEVPHLPPSVQQQLAKDPRRFRPRVRVTTDEKTGQVLAKIIKTRIDDFHVFSPACALDWRLSVNMETNWDGDLQALLASQPAGEKLQVRRKDRMSYRHVFCQIDLTQVKTGEKDPSHELEVELATSEVMRQGKLLGTQQANEYEGVVKSLVNNVRVLARHG